MLASFLHRFSTRSWAARGLDRLTIEGFAPSVLLAVVSDPPFHPKSAQVPASRNLRPSLPGTRKKPPPPRATRALDLSAPCAPPRLALPAARRRSCPPLAKVRPRLIHDVNRERERSFVEHCQRPHRHAREAPGALDHRGRDAYLQHRAPFHHVGAEDAAGEEAARVVDDDRRLAEREHVVVGARERLRRGRVPLTISTSGIPSTGEEESAA